MSKIPLHGDGMATIPKIFFYGNFDWLGEVLGVKWALFVGIMR